MLCLVASIGSNIKKAREAAGMKTQAELAKKLGVPQPQMSDWENDRYAVVEVTTLIKIAAAIPCALDALVEGLNPQYDSGRDLLGHTGTGQLDARKGAANVPVETRIRQLEGRVAELQVYQDIVRRVRPALTDLLVAIGDEGDKAAGRKSPRRRRD